MRCFLWQVLLFIVPVLFTVGCADHTSSVFARVNGQPLSIADLKKNLREAGGTRTNMPFEKLVQQVVDDAVNAELIYQTARGKYGSGLIRQEVVRKYLDENVYAQILVTEEQTRQYFADHYPNHSPADFARYRVFVKKRLIYTEARQRYDALMLELRRTARVELDRKAIERATR